MVKSQKHVATFKKNCLKILSVRKDIEQQKWEEQKLPGKTMNMTDFLLIASLFPSIPSQWHHTPLQRDPSTQTGSPRWPGPPSGQRQHSHPFWAQQTERQFRDAAAEEVLRAGSVGSELAGQQLPKERGQGLMGKNERNEEESWHKDTCRDKQLDARVLCRLFLCLHEPSSLSTEARGGRGSFHSVHCLIIVILQGFTSFYFLRTFGELYTGKDMFVLFIHCFGCWVMRGKAESKTGRVVEGGI